MTAVSSVAASHVTVTRTPSAVATSPDGTLGACVSGSPSPGELLDPGVRWTVLVPRTPVGGHAANGFPVAVERRFTHLRLNQHPDGGIARVRVYGEVVPDPGWLAVLGTFDVAALQHGGTVEDASDLFYSPAVNTIRPGRSLRMDDGWETRRRRDRGHDWIRYRLAAQSLIRAVEIDTAYLKGNSAGWASVSVRDAPARDRDATGPDRETSALAGDDGHGGRDGRDLEEDGEWRELVPRSPLQPDTNHRFVLPEPAVATHARLDIFPDGGISRLRLHGSPTDEGAARLADRFRRLAG